MTARARSAISVLALIVFALVLRFTGTRYLLPHTRDNDSDVVCTQVELIESGDPHPERDFNYGYYPLLLPGLVAYLTDDPPLPAPDAPVADHLDAASSLSLRIRHVAIWLSLFGVPATWFLARRFLDPLGAWIATAFTAVGFLELWTAQQAQPHTLQACFALLSVVAAVRLRRVGGAASYLVCGLCIALAIGSLQNGLAALVPLAAALLLRSSRAKETPLAWTVATVALIALAVYILYPFMFHESQGKDAARLGVQGGGKIFNLSGHEIDLTWFNGGGFLVVGRTLLGYEPWMTALALAGAVLAVPRIRSLDRETRADLLVVLAYAIPYLLAIGIYQNVFARFVLPLMPYSACLAAYAVVRACGVFRARWVTPIVVSLALLPQVYACGNLAWLRSHGDTGRELAAWIESNVGRSGTRIAIFRTVDVPLLRSARSMRERPPGYPPIVTPWFLYQYRRELPQGVYEIDTMRTGELGYPKYGAADLVIVEPHDADHVPVLAQFRADIARAGKLVLRLSPDKVDDGLNYPLTYRDDLLPHFMPCMWRSLRARCLGQVLEVYDLRKNRER